MPSRPAVSDAGRSALRLVPPSPHAAPPSADALPYAVVKHEITPQRWLLQTHDGQGLPGVCVVVTRPEDQRNTERLIVWLQDYYRGLDG